MAKTSKLLYLLAAIAVVAATAFVLINSQSQEKKLVENYQPIEGAKASSYELANGAMEIQAEDNIIGSEKSPLKIFVYEDYSSPYSAELADTLNRIYTDHLNSIKSNDVAIVVRPFVTSGSSVSRKAALASICAKDLGKWEEMRQLLLKGTKDGLLQDEVFDTYATELQLNVEEFNTCLTNEEKSVKLDESMVKMKEALVLGAPTMVVGDEMILGSRPYADFVDSNGDAIEGLETVVNRKLGELGVK